MGQIMLISFFILMFLGLPLYLSLLSTALIGIASLGDWSLIRVLAQQFYGGMDVFSLMAIPFFILTGILMNRAGLTDRLMDFSRLLVGSVRGGLGYVNVVAGIILAGVNGSAAADASALGSILIPAMVKDGFSPSYAAGLTASSSLIGPIIPPSIPMIIYAVAANASVAKLFMGGILPGVTFGVLLMIYSHIEAVRFNYPREEGSFSVRELARAFRDGFLALLMPVIILGGIRLGIFTATESSAIAVVYAFIIGKFVYGELTWKRIPDVFAGAARSTSAVMFIIAVASFLSWVLTSLQVPQTITLFLTSLSTNPTVILLVLNAFILFLGCFIDAVSIIVLITPVALPVIHQLGIDPVLFGLLLVCNVCIGALTPPVGTCLFVASSVGRVDLSKTAVAILPIVCIAVAALVLGILFPQALLWLPDMIG